MDLQPQRQHRLKEHEQNTLCALVGSESTETAMLRTLEGFQTNVQERQGVVSLPCRLCHGTSEPEFSANNP